ncbi:MAG: RNA 2',3'-cyclic phosphodiesterase [Candidatus Marsarchaeota archaeon]|nr:RNA 2',3'-cyclic phosphodiesterase [Candidatus Marsarchaeota archaeon]
MRAFASIEPDEELLSKVYGLVDSSGPDGIRIVEKDKLHLTLLFMGNAQRGGLESLSKMIELEHFGKFNICFRGFDVFTRSNPRVLFAKVVEGATALGEIHDRLASMASECGIAFDGKQFAPHLTVGRFAGRVEKAELDKFIDSFEDTALGCFTCRAIKLKKSEFLGGKSVYSDIYVKDFDG